MERFDMTGLLLSPQDLEAIDRLLGPVADGGRPEDVLPLEVLRALTDLFPHSVAGVSRVNAQTGKVLSTRSFRPHADEAGPSSLRVTVPSIVSAQVIHVFLARASPVFTPRDMVLFRLLTPMLRERVMAALNHRPVAYRLSPCELRVLTLVAQGASNRQVSDALSVSVATVRKHLEHVYDKVGVRNRTGAVAMVFPQAFAT